MIVATMQDEGYTVMAEAAGQPSDGPRISQSRYRLTVKQSRLKHEESGDP